jgi:hypothetical protein
LGGCLRGRVGLPQEIEDGLDRPAPGADGAQEELEFATESGGGRVGHKARSKEGRDGGHDGGDPAWFGAQVDASGVRHGPEVGDDAQEVELEAHGHALRFGEGHADDTVHQA